MADEPLRMTAEVVDKFSGPLRKLRSELASIKSPADLGRLKDHFTGLERGAAAAGNAVRNGLGAALSAVGISALGVAGAIGASVAAFKNFAFGTAELRHLSKEIGLSVDRLRQLQALGERFGIDTGAMQGGLKKFSDSLYDIQRRRGEVFNELLKAGPGGRELADKLVGAESIEDAVGHVLGVIERIPNAVQRQRFAETLFGSGMFGRLGEGGPGSVRRNLEEIQKALGKLGPGAVDAAQEFERSFSQLREKLTGLRDDVGSKALPELNKALKELGETLKGVDWADFGKTAGTILKDIIGLAGDLIGVFRDLKAIIGGDFSSLTGPLLNGKPAANAPQFSLGGMSASARQAQLERQLKTIDAYIERKRDRGGDVSGLLRQRNAIDDELRRLKESVRDGVKEGMSALIQRQSFGGSGGFDPSMIHKASLGGSGGGGLGGGSGPSLGMPSQRGDAGGSGAAASVGEGAPVAPFKGGGNTFATKAPAVMRRLMSDFGLSKEQAAGIVGNLGHESGGFTQFQEKRPLIPGSRGGWGWAQWTGPRRRAFESWAKERGLDPRSDEANYGFLAHELRGSEKGALAAVRRQSTAAGAMQAFELGFERSGVKAWGSRSKWTGRALTAFAANGEEAPTARLGDEMMRRSFPTQKVEGAASVRIDLNGFPRGTRATADATGMFKDVTLDRGRQMVGAD